MQVVSIRRLDKGEFFKLKKKLVHWLPVITVSLLLILFITSVYYLHTKHKTQNSVVTSSHHTAELQFGPIVRHSQMNLEQILPDSNDQAVALAQKLLQALPQANADCSKSACVALTFDDGPEKDSTPLILAALEKHGAQATFFEIGKKVAGNGYLLQRMQADGDDIGNHSWSHPSFLKLKPAQIRQQVEMTQKVITAQGVEAPHLFRPPYGDFLLKMEKNINLAVILWDVDPKDWAYSDPSKIVKSVETEIRPGAIIVMHDKVATAKSIDKILTDLQGKYHFVTVSKLLNLKPTTKGAYVGLFNPFPH